MRSDALSQQIDLLEIRFGGFTNDLCAQTTVLSTKLRVQLAALCLQVRWGLGNHARPQKHGGSDTDGALVCFLLLFTAVLRALLPCRGPEDERTGTCLLLLTTTGILAADEQAGRYVECRRKCTTL